MNKHILKIITVLILICNSICLAQGTRIEIEKFRYTNTVAFTRDVVVSNTTLNTYTNPNLRVYGYSRLETSGIAHATFGSPASPIAYIDRTNGLVMNADLGAGITLGNVRRTTWPESNVGYLTNFTLGLYAYFDTNNNFTVTRITGGAARVFAPWKQANTAGKYASSFNLTNGVFTVPVAGYWQFSALVQGFKTPDNQGDPYRVVYISFDGDQSFTASQTKEDAPNQAENGLIFSRLKYVNAGVEVSFRAYQWPLGGANAVKFQPVRGELTAFYYGEQPWSE